MWKELSCVDIRARSIVCETIIWAWEQAFTPTGLKTTFWFWLTESVVKCPIHFMIMATWLGCPALLYDYKPWVTYYLWHLLLLLWFYSWLCVGLCWFRACRTQRQLTVLNIHACQIIFESYCLRARAKEFQNARPAYSETTSKYWLRVVFSPLKGGQLHMSIIFGWNTVRIVSVFSAFYSCVFIWPGHHPSFAHPLYFLTTVF